MYHDDDDKQVAPGRSINDPETPERHNAEARRARFLASRAQSRDVQVSSKSSTNGGKVSAMGDVVEEKNSAKAQDLAAIAAAEAALKKKSELIAEEKAEKGSVSMAVVKKYILAVGKWMSLLTIMCYMAGQAMAIGSNLWLSKWTSDTSSEPDYVNSHLGLYLGVYAGLGIGMGVMVLVVAFVQAIATIIGARMLHKDMLQTIMRSPMSFFDTTPVGRVINRFSKDIYAIDEAIPRSIRSFLATFFKVISVIIVIAYATRGIFLVAILPLGVFYVFLQRFYVATARQLKRLDSVTRSPIYAHFGETVTGVATIRAYDRVGDFIQQNEDRVDSNQRAYYPNIAANRWLAVRLEIIGNLIVLLAGVFAVLGRKFGIDPGLVGLSVSYALNVTQSLNWMVRMSSQLETDIVAVERVKEYTELPVEAPPVVASERPASNWPERGDIVFRDFSVRYRDDLELVLRNINVDIAGGEKVGICGRTGAGKSSLTLCLFRLLESAGGSITIDGRNIARMGLDDLRSRLTIIPQDPVLFSGTMRLNLDPFDAYEDVDLWRALERAHLKEFVSGLPDKLEAPVAEGGDNLSVGQRQLVCLARALLRKTRVLILDEATAAVDLETDTLIQATIRSEFSDCTVITIAHRINTIMDSSRILVLDAGRVAELDTPAALMADRSTIFYSMAMQAGITSAQGASSSDV
jgi:ABC-type multidrug transport system fused ATPase/permease subunit